MTANGVFDIPARPSMLGSEKTPRSFPIGAASPSTWLRTVSINEPLAAMDGSKQVNLRRIKACSCRPTREGHSMVEAFVSASGEKGFGVEKNLFIQQCGVVVIFQ
jgi:hypothetical protein